jgi:hypothetical protein
MSSITQYKVPRRAKMVLNGMAFTEIDMDEQKKQVVDDGILFPAGESCSAFDELCHILQCERRGGTINIDLPGEFGHNLSEVVVASSRYEFTTRCEVRVLDLYYNTEQMRLEM